MNLDGDSQSDLIAHGGIYKAAYAYSIENYEFWKRELNRTDFTFGQFGENLTVDDILEDKIHIWCCLPCRGCDRRGNAAPRAVLQAWNQNATSRVSQELFLASNRVGFYLRVLQEGEVGTGDTFELIKAGPEQMTVHEVNHLLYFDPKKLDGARSALRIQAPVARGGVARLRSD
jgi:MOSC domain-containing protein YiiM